MQAIINATDLQNLVDDMRLKYNDLCRDQPLTKIPRVLYRAEMALGVANEYLLNEFVLSTEDIEEISMLLGM